MQFDNKLLEFLKGDKFSGGMFVEIAQAESTIPTRAGLIEEQISGKDIIHLGCSDHIPVIKDKIKRDLWMHGRLCRTARRCLGVDIDTEAVEYLKTELGYTDIVCANLLSDDIDIIKTQKWDYMVMGEILEHVDNPVMFLNTIREKYAHIIDKLIITVPNAFSSINFKNALKHKEHINTDHRYWFTPYTLAKVVIMAGLTIENFQLCEKTLLYHRGLRGVLIKARLKKYPVLRDTIVMVVKI